MVTGDDGDDLSMVARKEVVKMTLMEVAIFFSSFLEI